MHGAAKKKSITPAGPLVPMALRVLLLLIVTLFLPQTRVWGFENSERTAPGVFAAVLPVSTGENDDAWAYDVPDCSVAAETTPGGLGNPFKGKTAAEIDEMFKAKGYAPRGPDPVNGKGGYVNPENQRSYHIDEANSFGEPPHVDVNRLKTYKGPLEKKKYEMGGG